MNSAFILFWAVLIFASVAWYAFLVVYVGIKAGRDIITMTKSLEAASRAAEADGTQNSAGQPNSK